MFNCFLVCQTIFLHLEQCFNGTFEAEKCDTGVCYFSIYDSIGPASVMSRCIVLGETQSLYLLLVYFMNVDNLTKKYDYALYCNYDKCNGPRTAEKLRALIKTHHDINALLDILGFPDESEEKETTTSTTVKAATPKLTNTSTSTTRPSSASSTTKSRSSSTSTTSRINTNDMGRTSTLKNGDPSPGPIKALVYALHLLLVIHLL